ncbi:site-specific integrase, partial [Sphingobacterium sp. IITKGP-BTPF85]
MKNIKYLSTWVRRFLTEYVINNRNLSPNTLASYRDTMRLIIPYASKLRNKSIDKLMIEDLNADLIKNFLSNIETERKCSISTRNQRLAAINSFAKFVSQNCIDYIEWVRMIKLIPIKKGPKKTITYL